MGAHNNSENFKITRKEENNIENEESVAESFSNAIHSGGKHIAMNEDVLLTETLEIDVDDIVLDGQGHTIQGGAKNTPILLITSNKVTLKNITFKKADSNTDGAAINNLNSDAQIINCEFIGNKAPESNGGAIYNHYGKLNIRNCNFKDNRSETKDGGAIFNFDGEVTIDECNFENNYAKFGGAIYNGKSLNLKNTNFINNSSNSGPALFNTFDSVTTIENCTFKRDEMHSLQNNFEIHNRGTVNINKSQKEKIEDIIQGGFIHISSKNAKSFKYLNEKINSGLKTIKLDHDIINKEFKNGIDLNNDDLIIDGNNLTIDGLGKGIFNVNGKNITLKNINFRNGSSIEGGAINNKSESLTLTDCNFDCNISNAGGAINNYGTIDAENCNFRKNIANGNNGGAINNTGDIKLTKCNFLNNYSDENGGAINNSNKLNTYDCCFISNHAKNGASINNIKTASLNLINTKFLQNKAVEQGSILYNENSVYMKDCKTLNNISSSEYSNIIYQKGDETTCIDIQNCVFSREKYNNNLIFVENGSCDIHSTKFNLKKEHENSYAIYNENAILKVKDLAFENIDNEIIFNNNIIHIENDDDIESLIKPGKESLPFKYNTNQ